MVVIQFTECLCLSAGPRFLNLRMLITWSMAEIVLGIYVIKYQGAELDPYEDVGVMIEGIEVLQDLGNVVNACAQLLSLICALNLA